MSSKFLGVNVVRAANIYFEGNVTSRSIEFSDGELKTLGIMLPGQYTFNTDKPELMEIQAGSVKYRLSGSDDWVRIEAGGNFNVPGKSAFDIEVLEVTDYCCSFLDSK